MFRARKNGVYTPHLILIDELNRKIYMEYIENSITVKAFIWSLADYSHPSNTLNSFSNATTRQGVGKCYSENA